MVMDETAVAADSVKESLGAPPPTIMQQLEGLMRGEVSPMAIELLIKGGVALLALIVTYFVAKLLARWVGTAMCKRVDVTLGKFAGKITFYGVIALALTILLPRVGFEIAGLAAVLAAAGFAIGLSFQGTLSNFAAGILLLVFRPFKVGDMVIAAGVTGRVNEIDLFTTTFDTPDNRRLIVPNSSISGATIENVSYHKERRVDVTVGVAYHSSLDETRAVLVASAEALADKMIVGEKRGYQIILSNLGASSVDWTVRFWAATDDFFEVRERLTTEIKRQLDAHQIQIPFPQMQLHISEPSQLSPPTAAASHPSLPIPKMNLGPNPVRGSRVRPRARGENI
jgi:small conductance mechanosensitive channel